MGTDGVGTVELSSLFPVAAETGWLGVQVFRDEALDRPCTVIVEDLSTLR